VSPTFYLLILGGDARQMTKSKVVSFLCLLWLMVLTSSLLADDAEKCRIRLNSLSKTSGVPGDTFEMYGVWGETQGAKTPSINKGGSNKLEVLLWSNSVIKVRIPESLLQGSYKVGVYCNNPPYRQASNWMNFEVTGKAGFKTGSPEDRPLPGNTKAGSETRPRKSGVKAGTIKTSPLTEKGVSLSSYVRKNLKIIGIGAIALLIAVFLIIAHKKRWIVWLGWIEAPKRPEKRIRFPFLILLFLLILFVYLFLSDRNTLNDYVSRLLESKITPVVLFACTLFLLGYLMYRFMIGPARRLRRAAEKIGLFGFSKVVKLSSQWDLVKDFISASFIEDSKFGGSYDFYIEEIYIRNDYKGFMVLFQNIITHSTPFHISVMDDVINWPGSFMFVVIEPTTFKNAVFIRRRLNGNLMIPGKIAGRGRSAEELRKLGIEVHEIEQHLSEEFKRLFGAYEVSPLGETPGSRLPSELQDAFIRIASPPENINLFDAGVSDFGGYVKFLPNGFIIHVAYGKIPKDPEGLRRIIDFAGDILGAVKKAW